MDTNNSLDLIFSKLSNINIYDVFALQSMEQEIALILKENPNNTKALVCLLKAETFLGKPEQARAVANKILSIGGMLAQPLKLSLIDSLINIGFTDKAESLLQPYISNPALDEAFYIPMLKLSMITGSISLMEKTLLRRENQMIRSFVEVYRIKDYFEHFKQTQHIIYEEIKDSLCLYNFKLYQERGFVDLESIFHITNKDVNNLWHKINNKIEYYHISHQAKRLNNIGFVLVDINNR